MTKTDKIIIGSTVVVATSAVTMLILSQKYEKSIKEVQADIQEIQYVLSRSREDILVGNREIVDGNRLLRSMVKEGAEAVVSNEG